MGFSRLRMPTKSLIAGSTPVIATIGERGGGFIAEIKRGRELWELTHINRNDMPPRILAWLAERL
jgi:hypothetical protein